MKPLNTIIGNGALCAWQPVPGITWVQTRSAIHARRLAQRSDSLLVVVGVAGGYLRTFELRRSLAWAERLIARHIAAEMSANARMIRPASAPAANVSV
jgi:precorrin-2 methylase